MLPLAWLAIVTMTAGLEKIFSADPRLGFLAHAAATAAAAPTAISGRLIFNDRLDAVVAGFFIASFLVVLIASMHEWWLVIARQEARGVVRGTVPGPHSVRRGVAVQVAVPPDP